MGMFDRYNPKLPCPLCGARTADYQGKSGPCGLFEYNEGGSIYQAGADDVPSVVWGSGAALPDVFNFYDGTCTECGFGGIRGLGYAEQGTWVRSELDTDGWSATRVHAECAICDACDSSIDVKPHMAGAYCNSCKRFVALVGPSAA